MECLTEPPAVFFARPRVKGRVRTTPCYWCRRCGWQVTRREDRLCTDCVPDCTAETANNTGAHLRRVIIARLLAEKGPMTATPIARHLGLTREQVYAALSTGAMVTPTPEGYSLTDAGRQLLRRYEGRAAG